jgi:ATP-dependent helicase/nuclease subunit A
MSPPEENYKVYEKELRLNIPIIKSVEDYGEAKAGEEGNSKSKKIISINENQDKVKNEIISATKTAMFLQCPLKYKLTYELGYTKILKIFNRQLSTFDYKYKEDDETNELADLRGRVIHSVLEKEIESSEIESSVKTFVENELETREPDYKKQEELVNSIIEELKNYFSSKTFEKIKSYKNFNNEFEIYSKENDYYLYGIIDKLIIDGGKIVIVDYKTDNIKKEQIEERGLNYLPQLKFYSFLAKKMFKDAEEILCRLVFIKHPENVFERNITLDELDQFKGELKNIVNEIRDNQFPPKLSHCSVCHYAVKNGKCVYL